MIKKITKEWLREQNTCASDVKWFFKHGFTRISWNNYKIKYREALHDSYMTELKKSSKN